MAFIIEQYRAAWNPGTKSGIIFFRSTERNNMRLEFHDPAEFSAVLAILTTSDDARINDDGTIQTGAEEVGD
jgi:hypothetical protein